jgi:hypothetical protein
MPDFLSRKEAAAYVRAKGLPVSPLTLQKYATTGGGPLFQIFGNRAVYKPTNLDRWIGEKLSEPRGSSSAAA